MSLLLLPHAACKTPLECPQRLAALHCILHATRHIFLSRLSVKGLCLDQTSEVASVLA